jgi:hypothetical protein
MRFLNKSMLEDRRGKRTPLSGLGAMEQTEKYKHVNHCAEPCIYIALVSM